MGQIKVWHLLLGVIMVITGVTMMQFEPLLFPREQSKTWVTVLREPTAEEKGVYLACQARGEEPMDNCWSDYRSGGRVVSCRKEDGSVAHLYEDGTICTTSTDGLTVHCER